jgi:hypothetical protein
MNKINPDHDRDPNPDRDAANDNGGNKEPVFRTHAAGALSTASLAALGTALANVDTPVPAARDCQ